MTWGPFSLQIALKFHESLGPESASFSHRPIPPAVFSWPTKGWFSEITGLKPLARPSYLLVDPGDICPPQWEHCCRANPLCSFHLGRCFDCGHFISFSKTIIILLFLSNEIWFVQVEKRIRPWDKKTRTISNIMNPKITIRAKTKSNINNCCIQTKWIQHHS
jgi:hypothetical protein